MMAIRKSKNPSKKYSLQATLSMMAALAIILWNVPAHSAELCKEGKKQLRGDYEILQGSGGLWGYLEKAGLKDKSVLGLQVDGKLQRAVVAFETLCDPDSQKKPDETLFNKIKDGIVRAMSIHNKTPGRTPIEEILSSLETLSKDLDGLLQSL
ncbi:MAG: hypothetical protein HY579_02620 [Nitrospinae bacterium]|nr:hypothetical protein [Nitrospinota bacterium]